MMSHDIVAPPRLELGQPFRTIRFSCHSMLPQPNKQKCVQLIHIFLWDLSVCLLQSGIHLYHIEILARYSAIQTKLWHCCKFQLRYLLYTLYTFMRIFHYPSSSILLMALLNLARYYPYTLLVSVPICLPCKPTLTTYRQCQGTSFNIRISTVLGRFYYGISRHSTQIGLKIKLLKV